MTPTSFSLQQALIAAARDVLQRARAISALKGAEVWTITWPTDGATPRTLTNSSGLVALPVFSDERHLVGAAVRYAWQTGDGRVPHRKMHISEAMRYAKLSRAEVVIIDLASDHALELDQGEMDLVASLPSTRPPPADRGYVRTSAPSTASDVVRASARPPDSGRTSNRPPAGVRASVSGARGISGAGTPATSSGAGAPGAYGPFPGETMSTSASVRPSTRPSALRPRSVTPHPGEHAVSATFGAAPTSTMVALERSPDDELLDELSVVLKDYPEVEWASLVGAPANDQGPQWSVALRMAADFRVNLAEISRRLRDVAQLLRSRCDVVVLDTPEQMKEARHVGVPFYPWRKK